MVSDTQNKKEEIGRWIENISLIQKKTKNF